MTRVATQYDDCHIGVAANHFFSFIHALKLICGFNFFSQQMQRVISTKYESLLNQIAKSYKLSCFCCHELALLQTRNIQ